MNSLTYYPLIIIILSFTACKAQPKQFDWGNDFRYQLFYKISGVPGNDKYNAHVSFLFFKVEDKGGYKTSEYYFYDGQLNDTLKFLLFDPIEPALFTKDSVYEILYKSNPGWPSTYGLIIKKNNDLVFEGITDWELNKTIKLVDSSFIKIELAKEFDQEADTTQDCYKKIIPVQYKFSIDNKSVLLRQGESKLLNGIKIYLGIAREVEYNSNCLDSGINGISFIAVNPSIK